MSGLILPYKGVLPTIDASVYIAPTASVIGDVVIGPDTSIWFGCTVRGDVNEIRIGARTNIQDGTVIHVAAAGQGTYIGDDISVGHMALLHACTIDSGCFIGMKACIMDGAHVESGAMVAAGALVTPGKRVRTGELWAGSPARPIRNLTKKDLDFFPLNVRNYVALAAAYRGA
ncbi:gamma carbonic anhydrase family protein [Azospirillum rugosum]|uniref:Carbonic anhydrase/acetyltransferase-like protein (Isoleucine patch superfamily) n=1 Tax=Azospirillum rugosum TaxID=416170 RepID=A0ABS4SF44_9PROT|nr:gamma carbonic anhydrase family protein [Azospirillum rugosum]MBP2291197.1 carbonic anhydrase/acetyltransferase-like protein (isoleucine patch superfamily) [Azospirillum rugosum]MDQ0524739.1 carbonic anhydrase/acetyltransferase-like protein (isoleucine patch superfamily) [Azospirillum rugosum]